MIIFNEFICKQLTTEKFIKAKYLQYFSPEVKPFIANERFQKNNIDDNIIQEITEQKPETFDIQREIGENDSFICKLIRDDSINDFISYVNSKNIPLDYKINARIIEESNFLIKKEIRLQDQREESWLKVSFLF